MKEMKMNVVEVPKNQLQCPKLSMYWVISVPKQMKLHIQSRHSDHL
uniref:Uncharacterized protein n=1 Tax=Anguilla anguilla TaxID=7936 RepID=A0A0E9STJ7_ANGAN